MFGIVDYLVYYLLALLAFLVIVVWIIVKIILHFVRGRSKSKSIGDKNWYLQISLSKEDGVSQLYFLLAIAFFGVTLFTINRNLGQPLQWYPILFFTSMLGLATAYYFRLIYSLAFSTLGVIVWWIAQAADWASSRNIQTSSVFSTLALLALLTIVVGTLHEIRPSFKRAATAFEVLGILLMAGILLFLSSNVGLDSFQAFLQGNPFYNSWQLSISLLVLFILLCLAVIYGLYKKLLHLQEAVTIAILTAVFVIIAFLPQMPIMDNANMLYNPYPGVGSLTSAGAFWAMAFNLLTLLGLLSVLLAGNIRRETWQINLGAILLFIYVLTKYFDWFYTFLDKSAFFIGAGILFFVIGFIMERSRKRIIQKINAPVAPTA